jgi:hypothetical protein
MQNINILNPAKWEKYSIVMGEISSLTQVGRDGFLM